MKQKVLDSNTELFGNEKHSSTQENALKHGTITKTFDMEDVDDIIESFDIMDATAESDEGSYSNTGQGKFPMSLKQQNSNPHSEHKSIENVRSKQPTTSSRKAKQGRSQVGMLYIYCTIYTHTQFLD